MQYLGEKTIAPGEDGYVFIFSRKEATAFCDRQERHGESQLPLTPERVRAGTTVLMTHAERQEFWKNSEFSQLLGLSD